MNNNYQLFETHEALAEYVGKQWKNLQNTSEKEFYISSPLSSTPLPFYAWIIENVNLINNWNKVKFVLMDEMLDEDKNYVAINDPASYENFARRKLLDPLRDVTGITIPIVKPDLATIDLFNTRIDLLIVALGVKGNYANVMPGTPEQTGWHITRLIQEFRDVHTQKGSDSFEDAHFGEYGMSLGPKQVVNAKKIIVMITGSQKKELARQLLSYNSFDPDFPLSIIYNPNVKEKTELLLSKDVLD